MQLYSFRKQDRETAYKLLLGFNFQGSTQVDKDKTLKYFEIGLHRTITDFGGIHPPTALTYGLSTEVLLGAPAICGIKGSAWTSVWGFVLGISTIYYTDFQYGNFKIRPEIGLGFYPFKLSFGYNIPTIYNKDFERVRRNDLQITLNILIKMKTLKKS